MSTFWQSDGMQPHYVNMQWMKKMKVQEVSLCMDFKTDESYTPKEVSVMAQNSFGKLE